MVHKSSGKTPFPLHFTMYRLCISTLLVCCTLFLLGCKAERVHSKDVSYSPPSEAIQPLRFTDSLDRVVTLKKRPQRVVALSASYAETWLLAGGSLVGATSDAHTRNEFTLEEEVAIIGTIKDPNSELIIALDPDLVLLSTDIPSHLALSDLLTKCSIAHAYFHVEAFDQYLHMLDIFTTLTGKRDLYRRHGLEIGQAIETLLREREETKEDTTYLLLRSYATKVKAKGGSVMVGAMLGELGLINLTKKYPSLLEQLSMESIVAENPSYIFVIPMGEEAAAQATMDHLLDTNSAFASLDAIQQGRYHTLPKNLFHYKPNNRWGDSYAYLAALLTK